jgi:hypothetical protein
MCVSGSVACVKGRDVFDKVTVPTALEGEAAIDMCDCNTSGEHPLPQVKKPYVGV